MYVMLRRLGAVVRLPPCYSHYILAHYGIDGVSVHVAVRQARPAEGRHACPSQAWDGGQSALVTNGHFVSNYAYMHAPSLRRREAVIAIVRRLLVVTLLLKAKSGISCELMKVMAIWFQHFLQTTGHAPVFFARKQQLLLLLQKVGADLALSWPPNNGS